MDRSRHFECLILLRQFHQPMENPRRSIDPPVFEELTKWPHVKSLLITTGCDKAGDPGPSAWMFLRSRKAPWSFFGAKDISVDLCIEPERSYVFKFVRYLNIKKTCLTNNWDDKLDVLFWGNTSSVWNGVNSTYDHSPWHGVPHIVFVVCHDRGLRRMFIHVYKDSLVANRKKKQYPFLKKKCVYENTVRYTYIIYIHIWYIYIRIFIYDICILFLSVSL